MLMELMPMQSIPMPCVASSGGDRHLCSRYHEPDTHAMCGVLDAHGTDAHAVDTHAHDTDTMSGILDAHAADAVCGILWR